MRSFLFFVSITFPFSTRALRAFVEAEKLITKGKHVVYLFIRRHTVTHSKAYWTRKALDSHQKKKTLTKAKRELPIQPQPVNHSKVTKMVFEFWVSSNFMIKFKLKWFSFKITFLWVFFSFSSRLKKFFPNFDQFKWKQKNYLSIINCHQKHKVREQRHK